MILLLAFAGHLAFIAGITYNESIKAIKESFCYIMKPSIYKHFMADYLIDKSNNTIKFLHNKCST